MDPIIFRRKLRLILQQTMGLAAAGTLASQIACYTSPSYTLNDGGTQKERVYTTERSPSEQHPPVDAGPYSGDFVPKTTIHCPYDIHYLPGANSEDCTSKKAGEYQLILPEDYTPESYGNCFRICHDKITSICQGRDGSTYSTIFSSNIEQCKEVSLPNNQKMIDCKFTIKRHCSVAGRRPNGLHTSDKEVDEVIHPSSLQEVGAFFAELAYLEEAAITAFQYLHQELQAYEAPQALIEQAHKSIQEEIEHATLMTMLAKGYGSTPEPVQVASFSLRPLIEIACENAKEGCIREAFGALLAMWQAEHTEDKAVQAVMNRIAYEESEHAALSFAIDEWVRPLLSADELLQLEDAHNQGRESLYTELSKEPSKALVQFAGFPTVSEAQTLFQALQQTC